MTVVSGCSRILSILSTISRENVWDAVEEEVSIVPNKARDIYVLVVNPEIVSRSQKAFAHFDERALAEVICPRLNAESYKQP
jgi:hypothetical protein